LGIVICNGESPIQWESSPLAGDLSSRAGITVIEDSARIEASEDKVLSCHRANRDAVLGQVITVQNAHIVSLRLDYDL
jgi:hypothetical protein